MTPDEFARTAEKIYGRKGWKPRLARDLGVDPVTIYRIVKREQIPGPYEVALRGLAEHRRQEVALERAARKLLPKGYRKRHRRHKPLKLAARKLKSSPTKDDKDEAVAVAASPAADDGAGG